MHQYRQPGAFPTANKPVDAIAPRLWDYEIRNSILMGLRRGRIAKADSEQFLMASHDLNVRLIEPASYDQIFNLAHQYGLTVYDAAYLDTAMREQLALASSDKQLIQAARASGIKLFQP